MNQTSSPSLCSSLDLVLLKQKQQALPYAEMTFPQFRSRLLDVETETSLVAVAACDLSPAGLALAEIQPDDREATILSLFVEPPFRNKGIGTALLTRLESELVRRDVSQGELVFAGGKPTTPALKRVLHTCGWTQPQPRMVLFQVGSGSAEKLLSAPLLVKKTTLPIGYEIFPWRDLTARERDRLVEHEHSGDFPTYLSPFKEPEILEPLTSLGLRYRDEVRGWLITHRIAPRTIRYTSLVVDPELPARGLGIRLVAEALRLHIAAERHLPGASGCCGSIAGNPLIDFLNRRVLPYMPDARVTVTEGSTRVFL